MTYKEIEEKIRYNGLFIKEVHYIKRIGFELLNSAGFASGTGQLRITNKNNGMMQVEVYNLTGKRVSNCTVSNQLILFPENYESGIYLIRISSDNQVFTARVVRQ